MWNKAHFLGQVAISPVAGGVFGVSPWGVGAWPAAGTYANSQGGPLMSEQVNSPSHAYEERHCYRGPSGDYVSIALGERDAWLAAGYVVVDTGYCGGAAMNGRRRMGEDPAPAPAPAPTPQPQPIYVPDYYPYPYPQYPYPYPPRSAYDVQAQFPTPTPVPTPAATPGLSTAVYVVGGAAVLLGAIALLTR